MRIRFYFSVLIISLLHVQCGEIKDDKPNIIFLLTDDQRDNTFSAMGHPFIKTPNTDKLIRAGVRFGNTYIAEPTCSPSRISLFTGMHERVHGVGFSSSYQLTEEQWDLSYPELLRQNGYFTGFIGKFGVEYYSFKGNAPEKFDYWWGHDGWTKFFPKDHESPSTKPYHKAKASIITSVMAEAIEDFFDQRSEKKPFCLSVSINVPHGSQTTSMYDHYENWHNMSRQANENPQLKAHPIYGDLYRDMMIPIPSETATDPYIWMPRSIMDHSKGRDKTYSYNYDLQTCQEHHIRYFQTITGLDKMIGELMASLEERGIADNTVIIFASDHGLLMGEYGMGGKGLLYDLASKIPCFIYDPNLPKHHQGKTKNELVSSLDLTMTILDYAGVEAPANMQGESLIPLVYGQSTNWREELFLENLFTLRDNPFCEGLRKGEWKYIRMFDGVTKYTEKDLDFLGRQPDFEQLFNIHDDPAEKVNLIEEYTGSEMLDRFRQKCSDLSVELNQSRERFKNEIGCMTR